MVDVVAQKELAAVRSQLAEYQYFQPCGAESIPLVKRLLEDLTKSVEAFQQYKLRYESAQKDIQNKEDITTAYKRENPRLLKENNELHRRLIEDGEKLHQQEKEFRIKSKKMEDDFENALFVQRQEQIVAAQKAKENEHLIEKVRQLEGITNVGVAPEPLLQMNGAVSQKFLKNIRSRVPADFDIQVSNAQKLQRMVADELGQVTNQKERLSEDLDTALRKVRELEKECTRLSEINAQGSNADNVREDLVTLRTHTFYFEIATLQ